MTDPFRLTEKEFTQQVLDLAAANRWKLRYHTWRSDHSAAGFPDLVLVRLSRIIFAELKTNFVLKVNSAQQEWLDGLQLTGKVEVYLWRPRDWKDIEALLA